MPDPTLAHQAWLRAQWEALATPLAAERAAVETTWHALLRHYGQAHRTYHNLSHIEALLRHAQAGSAQFHCPQVVACAIWFHDVIYDTRAQDNEQASARWARTVMQAMGIDEFFIAPVEQCILATQTHEVTPGVPDMPLFLDLDLSILGAPESVYRQYCQAIRAEYHWVPEPAYRAGRSQVLQRFLQRPQLFFTPVMAARFETRARQNLTWELRALNSL